ncbi:MAG: Mur ligase domain-containing protein, partial [Steroidobacteraceae bacterium]
MALAELTAGLATVPVGLEVSDVTLDSRAAGPGALFLACRGRGRHGAEFAAEALARGARAVLYEPSAGALELVEAGVRGLARDRESASAEVFVAPVAQLSRHAGTIADRFFGRPSEILTVAGITGTNGKTTCAWLLAQALSHCHRPAAYIGTL